jgi:hypothetical protein
MAGSGWNTVAFSFCCAVFPAGPEAADLYEKCLLQVLADSKMTVGEVCKHCDADLERRSPDKELNV